MWHRRIPDYKLRRRRERVLAGRARSALDSIGALISPYRAEWNPNWEANSWTHAAAVSARLLHQSVFDPQVWLWLPDDDFVADEVFTYAGEEIDECAQMLHAFRRAVRERLVDVDPSGCAIGGLAWHTESRPTSLLLALSFVSLQDLD